MKINVVDKTNNNPYANEVQISVTVDGVIEYCSHTNQSTEYNTFNDGTDREYSMELAVCSKCGAGWDEDGEIRLEAF